MRQVADRGAAAGFEPILRALLPLYPTLGSEKRSIRLGYQRVAHIAHGWYMRCHRGVQAILLLDSVGFAADAAPMRRSVIEHLVALKWLVVKGDKIEDTIARLHDNRLRNRREAVKDAKWTSVDLDEFTRVIEELDRESRDSSADYLWHFRQRCKEFGDEHTWVEYVTESEYAHATYESAMTYVNVDDGTVLPVPREKYEVWQVPFCTTELLEALMAVREIFEPKPWAKECADLMRQFHDVVNDDRKEKGLLPVDWPEEQELVDDEPPG